MKLQLVGTQNVTNRGGWRHRKVFETPNGTLVVKLNHGYYPVGRGGHIRMERHYVGRVDDCEVWESTSKARTITLVPINEEAAC